MPISARWGFLVVALLFACGGEPDSPAASAPPSVPSAGLTGEGGVWEGRYVDGIGGQLRPHTFLLADRGRFGWLESADMDDAPVRAMNGEGFLRTGTWVLDGSVLVVTETWRRHFDEATSREDEAAIVPPRVRRLEIGPCSPAELASSTSGNAMRDDRAGALRARRRCPRRSG